MGDHVDRHGGRVRHVDGDEDLLLAAFYDRKLLELEKDEKSGGYIVRAVT